MLENGLEICSCKRTKCPRHGKCDECIEYHKNNKRYPPVLHAKKQEERAGENAAKQRRRPILRLVEIKVH